MADGPQTTNEQAERLDAVIHGAIFDVGIVGAQAMAEAQFPFLAWPIVRQLFGLGLRWQAGFFYRAFARVATFDVVDAQTAEEKIAYDRAHMALQAAIAVGTPEDEQAAEERYREAVRRLVRFDGAAPVG